MKIEELLKTQREKILEIAKKHGAYDVRVFGSVARGEGDEQSDIDKSLWYTLSQGITTAPMASDVSLWPMLIDSAERFRPMNTEEQAAAVTEARRYQSIFPTA